LPGFSTAGVEHFKLGSRLSHPCRIKNERLIVILRLGLTVAKSKSITCNNASVYKQSTTPLAPGFSCKTLNTLAAAERTLASSSTEDTWTIDTQGQSSVMCSLMSSYLRFREVSM
jgi:hypothetical protein